MTHTVTAVTPVTQDQLAALFGTHSRLVPYMHQLDGAWAIFSNPFFMLADEMGAGKTKQTIDAAQALFHFGLIDRVLVITPASVRSVWYHPELGELRKHLWVKMPSEVTEYHAKSRTWKWFCEDPAAKRLQWVVTNYDFLVSKQRMTVLKQFTTKRTLLVLDESWMVKNHTAKRTKAALEIRNRCGRVVLLNGTPIANSPLDMFAQGNMMSPTILDCKYVTYFRARYAVMGGYMQKEIVKWQNLEDLQHRFAPYVLRRLKKDCMDLPEKMDPVILTATLSDETWKVYKQMRDDMVSWLSDTDVSVANQAITKVLRLSQITSGILGGIEDSLKDQCMIHFMTKVDGKCPQCEKQGLSLTPEYEADVMGPQPMDYLRLTELVKSLPENYLTNIPLEEWMTGVRLVGREKLDVFLAWFGQRLQEDPNFKLITWHRFLPELHRLLAEVKAKFPQVTVGRIVGIQRKADEIERERAKELLDPRTAPAGPVLVASLPSTGGSGLSLVSAQACLYVSTDSNLKDRLQSEDRPHREGQVHNVWYGDIVAEGPNGQRTIDHVNVKALHEKHNLAEWTAAHWVKALTEE